jgi:hypothetical protein
MFDDVLAEIEYGQIQQTFQDEEENVDDSPCPSISVGEGVNRLELIMDQGQLDQWIQVVFSMDEILKVLQLVPNNSFTFRGCIDDGYGSFVTMEEMRIAAALAFRNGRYCLPMSLQSILIAFSFFPH